MLNILGVGVGIALLSTGAICLDQAVHTTASGYEDATCLAKAGENQTSDYCRYEDSKSGFCYQYVSCCDYPVMSYSKAQPSNVSGVKMSMRARACSASNPCAAFYEWLKSDSATIQNPDKSSVTFPCKFNTAKLDKNWESTNYCVALFISFGPLLSGVGWCGVVSSSAEYPTLRDNDEKNQRLRPLWIVLIIAGPLATLACCFANRAPKPEPTSQPPASQAPHQSTPAPAIPLTYSKHAAGESAAPVGPPTQLHIPGGPGHAFPLGTPAQLQSAPVPPLAVYYSGWQDPAAAKPAAAGLSGSA
jgi:hypothetical protein